MNLLTLLGMDKSKALTWAAICGLLGAWSLYQSFIGFRDGRMDTKWGEVEGVTAYVNAAFRLVTGLFVMGLSVFFLFQ